MATTAYPANSALTLYDRMADPLKAIESLGEVFARSGFCGCDRTEQGQFLALTCMAEKKSPVQLVREFHVIEGRLVDRADALLAKLRVRGAKHKIIRRDPEGAAIEVTFDGQTVQFAFTWTEAQAEPFVWMSDGKTLKKNWRTPRARMQTLWARVVSEAVRTLAPEIGACIEDDEPVAPAASGPALNLAAPQPLPPPSESPVPAVAISTPQSPPIDIPITVMSAEAPAPTPSVDGKLDAETVKKLETIFGEHGPKCVAWLIGRNLLPKGRPLSALCADFAPKIIAKPQAFLASVLAASTPKTA